MAERRQLEQIYAVLRGFGYEVWMSHKGTMPVDPRKSNFENCVDAVDKCDLFLGLITPFYGSGKENGGLSITHRELLRAIEQEKLRWFLAHDHVVFARQLLKQYRFNEDGTPNPTFTFRGSPVLDDIRVIDMYEAAIRDDVKLGERTGNWVQQYYRHADAVHFVTTQFGNVDGINELLAQWRAR